MCIRDRAGDLAEDNDDIEYFPAYEIIGSHASRAMFYEPNLRSVNELGVATVMKHFFSATGQPRAGKNFEVESGDVICDEAELDRHALD